MAKRHCKEPGCPRWAQAEGVCRRHISKAVGISEESPERGDKERFPAGAPSAKWVTERLKPGTMEIDE